MLRRAILAWWSGRSATSAGKLAVPASQGTADVALEPDVFKLQEVVVTGQATGVERQNLPNAVATVDAADISRAPTPTLESALQGKIPGALIQANSGAPGGGIQLNLRGVSTINSSVDPLFVVDGIVISNAAIPNGANAVTAAQAGGNPRNQDNAVNRLADLNPADIEKIEVLKRRLGCRDLRLQGHQRRGDHHHQAGPAGKAAVQRDPAFWIL